MNNKKLRIAVLSGGPSAEHEVSLKTGKMVADNLDKNKYEILPIIISKKGEWPMPIEDLKNNVHAAFIAMHGEYGEDGTLQNELEKISVPFTGSRAGASRLGMDKVASLAIFSGAGLRVPGVAKGCPMVIKPADRGSSVGVSIIKNEALIPNAIQKALKYSPNIMMQQFITGREFTCGVLEIDGATKALPPTEIIPKKSSFFDYSAKYESGASDEITPPKLPDSKIAEMKRIAVVAHNAIGARGFSRTDMIMDKKGHFYALEINTIPGLTKTSLLPQQAKAAGIEFVKLLDIIIENSIQGIGFGV